MAEELIASFQVDHTKIGPGIFVSRRDKVQGGFITTFDIRMKRPNVEPAIHANAMHTIEHIFATFVRNSKFSESVLYFGPMGCRTGFYLLMRDVVSKEDIISLIKDAFKCVADFEGDIPGNSRIECGNYLEHDLPLAKIEAQKMEIVLKNWTQDDMKYKEAE